MLLFEFRIIHFCLHFSKSSTGSCVPKIWENLGSLNYHNLETASHREENKPILKSSQ